MSQLVRNRWHLPMFFFYLLLFSFAAESFTTTRPAFDMMLYKCKQTHCSMIFYLKIKLKHIHRRSQMRLCTTAAVTGINTHRSQIKLPTNLWRIIRLICIVIDSMSAADVFSRFPDSCSCRMSWAL